MIALATAAVIGSCFAEAPTLRLAETSGALVVKFEKTQSLVLEWPTKAILFKRDRKGRICVCAVTTLKDGVAVDGDY